MRQKIRALFLEEHVSLTSFVPCRQRAAQHPGGAGWGGTGRPLRNRRL